MDGLVKVSASVVSHIGMVKAGNENRFYMDGRFMHEYETDSVQVSLERRGRQYLFAVSGGMDADISGKSPSVSITRELDKYYNTIRNSSKDIQSKLEQLKECVDETAGLMHSTFLGGEGGASKKPSFAGLLIFENKAGVLNTGDTRIYLLRDGNIRQLAAEGRKAERLLKLGIITSEQAELLASRRSAAGEQAGIGIRKSEIIDIKKGDIFLLCSNGLTDMVDEERIHELLLISGDAGLASALLLKEALGNGGEDNVTALVVKIEKAESEDKTGTEGRAGSSGKRSAGNYQARQVERAGKPGFGIRRLRMLKKFVSTAVAILIIAGAFYGMYKLWTGFGADIKTDGKKTSAAMEKTEETGEPSTAAEETEETSVPEETSGGGAENAGPVKYVVKKGDSLIKISKMFYNDPDKYKLIMEANNIKDANLIKVGQELIIPEVK